MPREQGLRLEKPPQAPTKSRGYGSAKLQKRLVAASVVAADKKPELKFSTLRLAWQTKASLEEAISHIVTHWLTIFNKESLFKFKNLKMESLPEMEKA